MFLLYTLFLSPQVFADDKYPICKRVPAKIHLTIKSPTAEINLKPDCWSSLIVVAEYAKTVNTFYVGKGSVESLRQVGVVLVDGVPIAFAMDNKFRLRGNGKFSIRIASYMGAEI